MEFLELSMVASIDGSRRSLPPFLGATLRGAFGYLLKQTVCQVRHGNCESCLLRSACPYPVIFEGPSPQERPAASRVWMRKYPSVPQPFVLIVDSPLEKSRTAGRVSDLPAEYPGAVEQSDSRLRWGIRLFGDALRYWPYVVHVFTRAGEQGIGQSRVKYRIEEIRDGLSGGVLADGGGALHSQPTSKAIAGELPHVGENCTLRWHFLTPTRIADHGSHIDGFTMLLAARRRYKLLNYFYGDISEEGERRFDARDFTTEVSNLKRYQFSRFSGRQQRQMELHGLTGEIVIRGPWGDARELLAAVPKIHLGKSTSFGFGRVSWESI